MTELGTITVRFWLPDWVADERFDWTKPHYYDAGHIWAGSFSHETHHNSMADGLHRLKEVSTTDLNPVNPWVEIELECKPEKVALKAAAFKAKLERYLARFREGKAALAAA